jgi:hypothetical protein
MLHYRTVRGGKSGRDKSRPYKNTMTANGCMERPDAQAPTSKPKPVRPTKPSGTVVIKDRVDMIHGMLNPNHRREP